MTQTHDDASTTGAGDIAEVDPRTAKAVARLPDAGRNAVNLTGGMQAWHAAGLPVVQDDESPGTVG